MVLDDVKEGMHKTGENPEILKFLSATNLVVLKIQNIADSFSNLLPPGTDIRLLPKIMPPWPKLWMEYGMHFNNRSIQSGISFDTYLFSHEMSGRIKEIFGVDLLSLVAAYIFFPWKKRNPSAGIKFFVKTDGGIFLSAVNQYHEMALQDLFGISSRFAVGPNGEKYPCFFYGADAGGGAGPDTRGIMCCLYLPLFALSLSNCRNVTAIKHVIPDKLRKKRARRDIQRIDKYYTLQIDPMKKILKTEGQSDKVGILKAFHICRGHFADYTEGNGLFGKYRGVYWMPQHVRGRSERGEVRKDYEIHA